MKLGITIPYAIPDYSVPVKYVQRAEELGYSTVWTAENYGSDALSPLAFLAGLTKKIKLGSSIAQADARTPANLAMTAQTIDAMAGGHRMILGIGLSGPQIVEGWYGRPWGKPNYKLRDTVSIVKKIFNREGPVSHEGKEISLPYKGPGSSGLGKPLKGILKATPHIPIYLGTDSELNVRMTAEVADGWIPMHFVPGALERNRKLLEEGFAKRKDGKTLEDFEIKGVVGVTLTDDVNAALQEPKSYIALYVGGMGAPELNFHKRSMINRGYGDAAERIQELFMAGRREEAAQAVPDEFVDEEYLIGPAERIKERYKAWRDSGLTELTLRPSTIEIVELMAKIAL